jgi:hypothetical protein
LHGFSINTSSPVSPRQTRKTFLAKLAGLVASVGIAPRIFGKSQVAAAEAPVANEVPFTLRPEKRAVARSSESI